MATREEAMRCSTDLRKRVVVYVRSGKSREEAAERFGVGVASVYRWLALPRVESFKRPGPHGGHKLDRAALGVYMKEHPDSLLKETAAHFKVSANAVWYALKQMKVSRKKNVGLQRVVAVSK